MKLKLTVLTAAMSLLALSSCKDDDKKIAVDNKLTANTETIKLTDAAFIWDTKAGTDDDGNEYYRNELAFLSAGMQISANEDGSPKLTGNATIMTLLINNDIQELQPGTYTWQGEEHEQPFDLWDAYYYKNYDLESEQRYGFSTAQLVVTKSGDSFTLVLSGTAYPSIRSEFGWDGLDLEEDPIAVTLQYQGTLKNFKQDF
ncbi:hypothetical protein [Pseudochryseolinea flava]|uniref:Uncharacterized protein n=1 Tax=Pseudochryseolinea flava TaxID=2059302 RepID=A0A364Y5T2_9BACT|nr:hypothetical protein [Pseudochryseolinea flava]RAW02356.1 hypothetical protein DQQ10_07430 [Pseudochryseolinea flava]